jgi:hypothetical protein
MAWVKIDDSFTDHPKVVSAGPLGMALQVAALCYCNRYLTDGFIPEAVAHRLVYFESLAEPAEVIARLIEVGIWTKADGGYQIHDYLEYQPSKVEVEAIREQRRKAGKKGGEAKGEAKSKHSAKQTESIVLSKTNGTSLAQSDPEIAAEPSLDPALCSEEDHTAQATPTVPNATAAKTSAKQDVKQNESKMLSKSSSKTLAQFNPVPVPVPVPNIDKSMSSSTLSTNTGGPTTDDDNDINLYAKWERAIGSICSPSLYQKIESYAAVGMERSVIAWAIDQTVGADYPHKYIIDVLDNLMHSEPPILTMTALRNRERQRKIRSDPRSMRGRDSPANVREILATLGEGVNDREQKASG